MRKIEEDGYITNENDVYERLRAEANCDWAKSIKCDSCKYSMPIAGSNRLWCLMHIKEVDRKQWCTDGIKD